MIDLSKYRIIDLSHEVVPGERKLDGSYVHGEAPGGRPVEVQEISALGARMHFIQSQTHVGTHAEAPYKYEEAGAAPGSMPIESYMGEAAACDFSHIKAGEAVTGDDFQGAGVRPGDITIAWGSVDTGGDKPHLSFEAIDWLIAAPIKALVIENLRYAPPGTPAGTSNGDARFLLAGIPIIDNPHGLAQIRKPRVFFLGLPVKMQRVTAAWTRAIALEELD